MRGLKLLSIYLRPMQCPFSDQVLMYFFLGGEDLMPDEEEVLWDSWLDWGVCSLTCGEGNKVSTYNGQPGLENKLGLV